MGCWTLIFGPVSPLVGRRYQTEGWPRSVSRFGPTQPYLRNQDESIRRDKNLTGVRRHGAVTSGPRPRLLRDTGDVNPTVTRRGPYRTTPGPQGRRRTPTGLPSRPFIEGSWGLGSSGTGRPPGIYDTTKTLQIIVRKDRVSRVGSRCGTLAFRVSGQKGNGHGSQNIQWCVVFVHSYFESTGSSRTFPLIIWTGRNVQEQ